MLKHSLLLTFRNFKRFKSTFFINLIGLSSGLACVIFIYLWVMDELKVDKFHEKDNRLYRAMENRVKSDGIWTALSTPGILAESLPEDIPEIEYAASAQFQQATLSVGEKSLKIEGAYLGKDFFKIFSYPLIYGNADNVLLEKMNIVITESLARKLFNTTDNLIGKTIEINRKDSHVIAGVMKDIPQYTSEKFEFIIPYEKYKEGNEYLLSWGNTNVNTFVLLKQGADVEAVNEKLAKYIHLKTNNEITHRTLFLSSYSDYYLYGKYENGLVVGGRIDYVKLFSIIGIFILIIACINFMNLSTAKASRRIKEVGIKKAVGAYRSTLISQYLLESLMMSFLSVLVAILIVDVFIGQFNVITGKDLQLTFDPKLIGVISGIALITGILAGSYPALYLSGFSPATVLKGKLNTSLGELWSRKGLVVFQFVISIVFIVSVIVVYKQIEYVQSKYLGYDKDNIVYFYRDGKMWEDGMLETFLNEVRSIPGVVSASTTSHDMTGHNSGTYGVRWEGKDPENKTEFENFAVNYGLLETLGVEIVEGRGFSEAFGSDTANIIFNEEAIKFMGLKDPIGKTVKLWGKDKTIIGVAKDFHYESLHEKFKPLFFRFEPGNTFIFMAKIKAGQQKEVVAKLENLYQKLNPGFLFEYHFLDENYNQQYVAEQRVAKLSKYFAALAILISCLGLFGLAAFTAERRLKEIGIRKVLGSSEVGIIYLLSTDFTRIVLISIVLALPLSYWLTKSWLNSFQFQIDLSAWYFIIAALAALIITWFTVGVHAVRAARVNPVRCLKDE